MGERAALIYAAYGWPVLPLYEMEQGQCSCRREDCSSPAKHPRTVHGLHEASLEQDQIKAWWAKWPWANVGIRTGIAFDVLDVDGDEGWASLPRFSLPEGPMVRTGSGGAHLFFAPTGFGNRVKKVPGLDWRGVGGYVVAPPSRHASGKAYQWVKSPRMEFPDVPDELRSVLEPPPIPPPSAPRSLPRDCTEGTPFGLGVLRNVLNDLATTSLGARNNTLNSCAFKVYQFCAGGELSAPFAEARLAEIALQLGLPENEIWGTLNSAKSGLAQPRSAPSRAVLVGKAFKTSFSLPGSGTASDLQTREAFPSPASNGKGF